VVWPIGMTKTHLGQPENASAWSGERFNQRSQELGSTHDRILPVLARPGSALSSCASCASPSCRPPTARCRSRRCRVELLRAALLPIGDPGKPRAAATRDLFRAATRLADQSADQAAASRAGDTHHAPRRPRRRGASFARQRRAGRVCVSRYAIDVGIARTTVRSSNRRKLTCHSGRVGLTLMDSYR
jgi:hypothetical protein